MRCSGLYKKSLLIIMLVISGCALGSLAFGANKQPVPKKPLIKQIIVFGDSLSDTGNLYNYSLKNFPVPRSIPAKPYYEGHASNGPTWPEYLAHDLQWSTKPGDDIKNFRSTNRLAVFAYAGAWAADGLGDSKVISGRLVPDVQNQIKQYAFLLHSSKVILNPDHVLYIILAGGNDFLGSLHLCHSSSCDNTLVKNALKGIQQDVHTLETGPFLEPISAKHIVVLELPDLSLTPLIRKKGPSAEHRIYQEITAFNQQLQQRFKGDPRVTLSDVPHVALHQFYTLYKSSCSPHKQCLAIDSCISKRSQVKTTKETKESEETKNNPMLDVLATASRHRWSTVKCIDGKTTPQQHLFWDGIHPTTHIHKALAAIFLLQLKGLFTFDGAR